MHRMAVKLQMLVARSWPVHRLPVAAKHTTAQASAMLAARRAIWTNAGSERPCAAGNKQSKTQQLLLYQYRRIGVTYSVPNQ